jgi:hypothetical protein
MCSKSKDMTLFLERMLIKQGSLAHFAHIKCKTFIRILTYNLATTC